MGLQVNQVALSCMQSSLLHPHRVSCAALQAALLRSIGLIYVIFF